MKNNKYLFFGTLIMGMMFAVVLTGCISTGAGDTEDPAAAEKLAAEINAIEAESAGVDGAKVTLIRELRLTTSLTVPAGVTLDLTKEALQLGDNVAFTVNGAVDAKAEGIKVDSVAANPVVINGNGTIRLRSKGHLLGIGKGKKLTLDGVTLVGFADNSESLVQVGEGGEFVLKSGAITDNAWQGGEWADGGGVLLFMGGTFTLEGGTVQGGTYSGSFAKNTATNGAALSLSSEDTVKWGTGGEYTKGGATQTGGSDIGNSDETLIAK